MLSAPKLAPDGIFVTQSGPAGVLSSKLVFTAINSTLRTSFPVSWRMLSTSLPSATAGSVSLLGPSLMTFLGCSPVLCPKFHVGCSTYATQCSRKAVRRGRLCSACILDLQCAESKCVMTDVAQGWNLAFSAASQQQALSSAEQLDERIAERVDGELAVCLSPTAFTCIDGYHGVPHQQRAAGCDLALHVVGTSRKYNTWVLMLGLMWGCWRMQFLDGRTLLAVLALNKTVRAALARETHIYTVDNPKFIHGEGVKTIV